MCHVSRVMCHLYFFYLGIFFQSGGASRWRVCYQLGLPRLVCIIINSQKMGFIRVLSGVIVNKTVRHEASCWFSGVIFSVNEYRTAMGGWLLGYKKKIIFIFKTKKMVTKLGQFKELNCSNLVNCPNFVTIFCRVLKIKIIFFDIPSFPPPIAIRNSLTNQFFQKKLTILYIFNKKKCKTEEKRRVPVTFLLLLTIYRTVNFFGKMDWSRNSGPQWTGHC